jgi:hypothetical protein
MVNPRNQAAEPEPRHRYGFAFSGLLVATDRLIPQPTLLGTSAVKDLGETLQSLLDAIQMWLQCFARPVGTLNDILPGVTDGRDLSAAKKIWVASLLISLIISFPVLHLYGIEWDNFGYHLCNWMTTIFGLVVVALITHQVLLWLNLKSEFFQTLVMYTVLVTTYLPVASLLSVPGTLSTFNAVQGFKQHPISIGQAFAQYFQNAMTPTALGDVAGIAAGLVVAFQFGVLALFAESMSQWYGNDRFKCYSAVAGSVVLGGLAMILVVLPMQYFIMYAFVASGQ